VPRTTLDDVIIHVCASDGQQIGEFGEEDFRENLFANRFAADAFYWHEGMADWAPISNYRALAKTQRISFAPPMRRTVRIDMDSVADNKGPVQTRPPGTLGKIWKKLTGRG
jgi:GYF domain 2